jgi:hypothetical protein
MVMEREEGTEAARCGLGQKSIQATQRYGKIDAERAATIMRSLG